MNNLIAATTPIQIAPSGGFTGVGSNILAKPTNETAIASLTKYLSSIIGVLTIIAIIWSVFTIILGAISVMSSGGDKQALEVAKKKITTGVIGLVIVIVALFLVQIIGYLLGITDILNIQEFFKSIIGFQSYG